MFSVLSRSVCMFSVYLGVFVCSQFYQGVFVCSEFTEINYAEASSRLKNVQETQEGNLTTQVSTRLDKQKYSALNCKYFLTHHFSISFGCSKEPSH